MKKKIITLLVIAAMAMIPPAQPKAKAQVPPAVAIVGIVVIGIMGYMAIRAVIKIMNRAETNRQYLETNGLSMVITPKQFGGAVWHPIVLQSNTNGSLVDDFWVDELRVHVWQYTNSSGVLMAVASALSHGGTVQTVITNEVPPNGWVTFDFYQANTAARFLSEATLPPQKFYRLKMY